MPCVRNPLIFDTEKSPMTWKTVSTTASTLPVKNSPPFGTYTNVWVSASVLPIMHILNRHEIPIIEDDISAEVFFTGHRRPSLLKAYDRKDLVLTCSSFSKTLAPGFRIGWALPGKRFKDRVLRLKAGSTVCSAGLDQEIMARFLAGGALERHMRSLRSTLKTQVLKTALAVQKHFPPGTRFSFPEGGSLLWVELPGNADGMTIYQNAMKRWISILPGAVCSVSDGFKNYIRIGCGQPFTDETERAIRILGGLVDAHRL